MGLPESFVFSCSWNSRDLGAFLSVLHNIEAISVDNVSYKSNENSHSNETVRTFFSKGCMESNIIKEIISLLMFNRICSDMSQ